MFINVVTVGAFVLICLFVFLVAEMFGGRRRTVGLIGLGHEEGGDAGRGQRPTAGVFTRALAGAIPQAAGEMEKIERDLARAGYYQPTAMVDYMATRNALIVMILIAAGTFAVIADPGTVYPQMFLIGGLLLAALGYGVPRIVLHSQANRRVDRIQRGLPDALDLLRMCLTGGLPLREALKRVSHEVGFFHRDIAIEFEIIRRHSDANTMPSALREFSRRIDAPDVNALAALVSQTDRLGTHVSTALTDYADSVRRSRRQRAEERASKTSIKLLFPVVLCLAPPIYILLCGPPLIKLRNFVVEGHRPGGILDPMNYGERITPEEQAREIQESRRARQELRRAREEGRSGQ